MIHILSICNPPLYRRWSIVFVEHWMRNLIGFVYRGLVWSFQFSVIDISRRKIEPIVVLYFKDRIQLTSEYGKVLDSTAAGEPISICRSSTRSNKRPNVGSCNVSFWEGTPRVVKDFTAQSLKKNFHFEKIVDKNHIRWFGIDLLRKKVG